MRSHPTAPVQVPRLPRGGASLPSWAPRRRYLGGAGLLLILGAPGFAFFPAVGVFLAFGALLVGLAALFSFQVTVSGACPFCDVVQTVVAPVDGLSWRQIRERRTNRVFGVTCSVCRNRVIVRLDDRVALPAPKAVAGYGRW